MLFPSIFYEKNRQRLARMHPDSLIIIASNTSMQKTGDVCYPFHQDSNFYYLSGLNVANSVLIIDTLNNKTSIVTPEQSDIEVTFQGEIDVDQLKFQSGIDYITDYRYLNNLLAEHRLYKKVYFNLARNEAAIAINPHRINIHLLLKKSIKKISDIRPSLDRLRMYKQPLEIEAITKASRLTKETLSVVEKAIESGIASEAELSIIVNTEFAKRGVDHAYQPIIATGKNSLILHYITGSQMPDKASRAVLLDIGAEYVHYGADISRTYSLADDPGTKDIIEAVKKSQKRIISAIAPGMSWKEYHRLSQDILIEELVRVNQDLSRDNINRYFPHAVGHFLGLDTHDSGDYRRKLEPDMVITVEPGYYNPDLGFGVRFEDDILITKDGAQII